MKESAEHKALRLAIETLQLLIAAHVSVVTALLAQPGKCGAKVLRAAGNIHRTVRQQLKIIYGLRGQALHSDLKTKPAFRAQVVSDLGGKMALVKWERRKRDARTHELFLAARKAQGLGDFCDPVRSKSDIASSHLMHSNHASQVTSHGVIETTPRKVWRPQTDRTGYFRLAKITTGPREKPAAPRKISTRVVSYPRRTPRPFSLIELTASELRTPSFPFGDSLCPQLPNIGLPTARNVPRIERWPKK